jgi:hypothetical protein
MALNDFTKGGQTLFQNMRMFFDIFWKVVAIFLIFLVLCFYGLFYIKTNPYERYKVYTLIQTKPFSFLFNSLEEELNKVGLLTINNPENDSKIEFRDEDGYSQKMTIDEAINQISAPQFILKLKNILYWSAIEGLLISLLITMVIARMLIKYGQFISEKKFLRGTSVCKSHELIQIIKKRNKGEISELSVAGIPLPKKAEMQHIWINGTTGAGKTVAFSDIMMQIRKNNRRAVVYDIMGTYVSRFYRPGKDVILNPFDTRSPGWNPWAECHHSVDYEMLAASQIPIALGAAGEDPFCKKAAL